MPKAEEQEEQGPQVFMAWASWGQDLRQVTARAHLVTGGTSAWDGPCTEEEPNPTTHPNLQKQTLTTTVQGEPEASQPVYTASGSH